MIDESYFWILLLQSTNPTSAFKYIKIILVKGFLTKTSVNFTLLHFFT